MLWYNPKQHSELCSVTQVHNIILIENLVNVLFVSWACIVQGRVLTQASMGYVSLLVLASSGAMLGAWALNTNIVHFWVMQTVAMSLLLTLYSTIRAMIVDTVKPKDYSLGLSQSSLISQVCDIVTHSHLTTAINPELTLCKYKTHHNYNLFNQIIDHLTILFLDS